MTSILASIPRILARSGRQTAIGTDAAELHKAVSAVLDTGSNSLVLQEASSFSFADNVAELQDTCTHGAELVDNSNEQSKGATARLLWEQTTRLLTRIANEDAAQRRTYLRRQQDRLGSLVRAAVCIRSVLQHQEAALSLQNGRSDNQCDDERDHDPRLFRLMSQQHVCDLLEDVILDVDMLTLEKYGVLPTISLEPCPRSEHRDARVPAQPLLLKYILTEIIKNAAVAVFKRHGIDADLAPPVSVTVKADRLLSVSVSDAGTGMSPQTQRDAFRWFYTSDKEEREPSYTFSGDFGGALSGHGTGLPLGRVYATCLGGNLRFSAGMLQHPMVTQALVTLPCIESSE